MASSCKSFFVVVVRGTFVQREAISLFVDSPQQGVCVSKCVCTQHVEAHVPPLGLKNTLTSAASVVTHVGGHVVFLLNKQSPPRKTEEKKLHSLKVNTEKNAPLENIIQTLSAI